MTSDYRDRMDATTRQSLGQMNLWTIYNTVRDIERGERDIEWEGKRDTRNEKKKGNVWNGKGHTEWEGKG